MTVRMMLGFVIMMALTLGPFAGWASETGLYAGVSGGEARLDRKDLFLNMDIGSWPSSWDRSFDLTGTAVKIFAGYRFTRNIAFEASYGMLDGISIEINSAGGSAKVDFEGTSVSLAGVGSIPFENGVLLFAKVGMARSDGKLDCSGSGTLAGACASMEDPPPEWNFLHAIGAGYRFLENWSGQLEWEQVRDSRDGGNIGYEVLSLGVRYDF